MLHTCLNCGCLSCLTIPRELVEQQLGWKQDMPLSITDENLSTLAYNVNKEE